MSIATASATYLYCVVQSARDPLRGTPSRASREAPRRPRGLPGMGAPRALDAHGGVWVIAASAPLDRYAGETIDARLADLDWVSRCAVAHEALVEHFSRESPTIPMKLFTLFTTDERALAHVTRARRRIERLFAKVAGREEWGVRMLLDERRALAPIAAPAAASSGTEFLLKKKATKDARQRLVADALAEADRLFDALARAADDSRRRTPAVEGPTSRMLLDAAFLVPRRAARRFRQAATAAMRPLTDRGFKVSLTGPWPPYHFVAEEA